MTTAEIAKKLFDYCDKGDYKGAHEALFSPDAVSVEPDGSVVTWLAAINQKLEYFKDMTINKTWAREPIVVGSAFSLVIGMDVVGKDGKGWSEEEIGVYSVKDGKIVKQQFVY